MHWMVVMGIGLPTSFRASSEQIEFGMLCV